MRQERKKGKERERVEWSGEEQWREDFHPLIAEIFCVLPLNVIKYQFSLHWICVVEYLMCKSIFPLEA